VPSSAQAFTTLFAPLYNNSKGKIWVWFWEEFKRAMLESPFLFRKYQMPKVAKEVIYELKRNALSILLAIAATLTLR